MSSAPMSDAVIAALLLRIMESLSPTGVASTLVDGQYGHSDATRVRDRPPQRDHLHVSPPIRPWADSTAKQGELRELREGPSPTLMPGTAVQCHHLRTPLVPTKPKVLYLYVAQGDHRRPSIASGRFLSGPTTHNPATQCRSARNDRSDPHGEQWHSLPEGP